MGYTLLVKKCVRCKVEKPAEAFNFKYKSRGIRQKTCRDCTRLEVRRHYNNNRNYYLTKARERNKIVREENRSYIFKYLSIHSCIDCGEKDPVVLEFDHVKLKSFSISYLLKNCTLREIKQEIKKCEIRCANCHRKKTAKQFAWYKFKLPL